MTRFLYLPAQIAVLLALPGCFEFLSLTQRLSDECLTDTDCDDGVWCNGDEVCHLCGSGDFCFGKNVCESGFSQCCPEGVGVRCPEVNSMLCNEEARECETGDECRTGADCSDGIFCNGDESCISGLCLSGRVTCFGTTPVCNEEARHCEVADVANNLTLLGIRGSSFRIE